MDYVQVIIWALSWDAMLNISKVEIEFISDADMYLLFEKGMRGVVSYISKRYSKTNNKYLNSYDPKLESKHTTYLDANNLYGYVMYKYLPKDGFKGINQFDLNKYTSNSLRGCVSEADLKYPNWLRHLHYDYPLVQDKIEIKEKMLSSYQLKIDDLYNIPISNAKKLVSNVFDKETYVVRHENFQLYL